MFPNVSAFVAIGLQPIGLSHADSFEGEKRVLDRAPDEVRALALGCRGDAVNGLQRSFIEVDEDLRHMDNLYTYCHPEQPSAWTAVDAAAS